MQRELGGQLHMLPCHAIKHDIISGGEILSQIDLCAAVVASKALPNHELGLVTRAMNEVEFRHAVRVGDLLSCYGIIEHIGRTSVTVKIEVEVLRRKQIIKVTEATAVFVAVDKNGKASPINGEKSQRFSLSGLRPLFQAALKPSTAILPPAPLPISGDRVIALRIVMMPNETNGRGKIFGGRLMALMEGAGSFLAEQGCENPELEACVSRYMDKIEFRQAVEVNDILSCYGVVTHIGSTSIGVHVEAEVDRLGSIIPVTSANITFVAVNRSGAKIPLKLS